jgi:hypothetical protein
LGLHRQTRLAASTRVRATKEGAGARTDTTRHGGGCHERSSKDGKCNASNCGSCIFAAPLKNISADSTDGHEECASALTGEGVRRLFAFGSRLEHFGMAH